MAAKPIDRSQRLPDTLGNCINIEKVGMGMGNTGNDGCCCPRANE